tara:strand:+ start:445 stop:1092 length:648 start_codon:yes stop_codon:yes gene_type:complete
MTLANWRKNKLIEFRINSLYYFSHKNNIDLILDHGILPKNDVNYQSLESTSFADEDVQARRHDRRIRISDGTDRFYNIHDLVPTYLTPRTPTLYARRDIQNDIFFCIIKSFVLCGRDFAFSDGNAGSSATNFFYSLNQLDKIPMDVIRAESWTDFPDGKRQRNAEFLIYPSIPIGEVWRIAVNNNELKNVIHRKISERGLNTEISIDHNCFFRNR